MSEAVRTAFVTDGEQRPALAIVRSLARTGVSVIVGADRPVSLASSSRYCARHVTYPSPSTDRDGFTRFLVDFLTREKIDVVLPVTDITTHAVCANAHTLRQLTRLVSPGLDVFERVSDKWKLLELAQACDVPVPRTEFVHGAAGLAAVVERVRYPAVVKPTRSRVPKGSGWQPTSVHYATSSAELQNLFGMVDYLRTGPALIQERIVGPGVGVFMLLDGGLPIAEFAHRRLREKPPAGGVSVLSESVPVDPVLRDRAVRLLGPLGWHGVAMLEFKQDRTSGKFYLMEVNGRFWGSLQLAVRAGVDFPRLAFDLALGCRPAVPPAYRVGIKNRWLLGDLDHLVLRLFRTGRELHLASMSSRWHALADFVTCSGPGVYNDVFAAGDPGPFLHELREYAAGLWSSVVRRPWRRGVKAQEAYTFGH